MDLCTATASTQFDILQFLWKVLYVLTNLSFCIKVSKMEHEAKMFMFPVFPFSEEQQG